MTQQREERFENCRCPHCRKPLDCVGVRERECPFCLKELEAAAVWETRRYPGAIILPYWVSAFGWPMVAIGLGGGFIGYMWWEAGVLEIHGLIIGLFVISLGLIFFVAKLSTGKGRY